MSGTARQFVDFSSNTAGDSGENNTASILPIANGESVNGATASRPSESLRQRSEAIKNAMGDTLYLRDADRKFMVVMPAGVGITWPGSTTAAASGIPVLTGTLWMIPMLTPGFNQAPPIPPVASSYGTLHLKRASDNMDSILVTSQRRSYAAGDQISVVVSAGSVFSCTLDTETGYQRTIKIVATGSTTLTTVINALNALLPSAPDNTQLVTAALEGGAAGGDLILTSQAKQFVSGNYDGEGHSLSAANLASFFVSNPTSALAEGDTLCVEYAMVSDTASTGGRRQSIPENSNTALSAGQLFNSRVHPEKLANAIPLFKVIDNRLVTPDGHLLQSGNAIGSSFGAAGAMPLDFVNGNHVGCGAAANWADGTTNPTTTMYDMVLKIISDLGAGAGTAKIHGNAIGSVVSAGTLAAQLTALSDALTRLAEPVSIPAQNGAGDAAGWTQTAPTWISTSTNGKAWYINTSMRVGEKVTRVTARLRDGGAGSTITVSILFYKDGNLTAGSVVGISSGANAWETIDVLSGSWTDVVPGFGAAGHVMVAGEHMVIGVSASGGGGALREVGGVSFYPSL